MLGKGTLSALSSMPFGLARLSALVLSIQGSGCEVTLVTPRTPARLQCPLDRRYRLMVTAAAGERVPCQAWAQASDVMPSPGQLLQDGDVLRGQARSAQG